MPLPNTIDSYTPELDIFDRALADPKGVRVCYETETKAIQARFRFHQARALDRAQSTRIYDRTDKLYNKSPFDILTCKLREDTAGSWWIYIERHGIDIKAVEPLSEVET